MFLFSLELVFTWSLVDVLLEAYKVILLWSLALRLDP